MHPVNFYEFLVAAGQEPLISLIEDCYINNKFNPLHETALEWYTKYLITGGMPEAVISFLENTDFEKLRRVQNSINNSYIRDMQKYSSDEDSVKLYDIWNSLPEQLGKENKKFQYSLIKKGARSKDYSYPIHRLSLAGIVNRVEKINSGFLPLNAYKEPSFFKLYFSDIGLFGAVLGLPMEKLLLDDKVLGIYKGAVAEIFVCQELTSFGITSFYWQPDQYNELDFIFQSREGEIIPVEVKSGEGKTFRSLDKFMNKYNTGGIRISTKNFGSEGRIKSIPPYSTFCLKNK